MYMCMLLVAFNDFRFEPLHTCLSAMTLWSSILSRDGVSVALFVEPSKHEMWKTPGNRITLLFVFSPWFFLSFVWGLDKKPAPQCDDDMYMEFCSVCFLHTLPQFI